MPEPTGPGAATVPVVTGHRGSGRGIQENTMDSFRAAVAAGAGEVETDLRISRDGQIVLMHDATVDRTTNGQGPVGELSAAQLRELVAGEHQRVAFFPELLQAGIGPIQAELKEAEVVDALLGLAANGADILTGVTYISFGSDWLRRIGHEIAGARTALLSKECSREVVDLAVDIGTEKILLAFNQVEEETLAYARERGLRIGIFTPNTTQEITDVINLNPDSITTDQVKAVVNLLPGRP